MALVFLLPGSIAGLLVAVGAICAEWSLFSALGLYALVSTMVVAGMMCIFDHATRE